jgi:hypothetical protein
MVIAVPPPPPAEVIVEKTELFPEEDTAPCVLGPVVPPAPTVMV